MSEGRSQKLSLRKGFPRCRLNLALSISPTVGKLLIGKTLEEDFIIFKYASLGREMKI